MPYCLCGFNFMMSTQFNSSSISERPSRDRIALYFKQYQLASCHHQLLVKSNQIQHPFHRPRCHPNQPIMSSIQIERIVGKTILVKMLPSREIHYILDQEDKNTPLYTNSLPASQFTARVYFSLPCQGISTFHSSG